MSVPTDLFAWEDWLAEVHTERSSERDTRLERAALWAKSRSSPLAVRCKGERILEGGVTPDGVLAVTWIRQSDIDGMVRYSNDHRPMPPAAFDGVSLFDGPAVEFVAEKITPVATMLWWPTGIARPTTLRARCRDHLHHLDVGELGVRCWNVPKGKRTTVHAADVALS